MVSKKTSKKQTKTVKNKAKTEYVDEEIIEKEKKPTVKWQPVAKEEKKGNGNFFAKMIDFFNF